MASDKAITLSISNYSNIWYLLNLTSPVESLLHCVLHHLSEYTCCGSSYMINVISMEKDSNQQMDKFDVYMKIFRSV